MTDLKTFLLDYTGKIQQGLNGFFLLNFPFLVPTIWNDKVFRYKKTPKNSGPFTGFKINFILQY